MEHGEQAVEELAGTDAVHTTYFSDAAGSAGTSDEHSGEMRADRAPDARQEGLEPPPAEVSVQPRPPKRRAAVKEAAESRALTVVLPEPVALMARAMERAREPLACPLCTEDGGELVVRLPACRVIRAQEAGFPAFYRVIWNEHVSEWTDLSEADQLGLMRVVNAIERTLRDLLHPTKINLASLGNVVPHLHWHVIARFDWDSHFPAPIWGPAQRKVEPAHTAVLEQLMPQVDEVLRQRLVAW